MLLRVSSRFGSKVRGEVTLVREGLKVFGGLVVDPRMRRDAKRAPSAGAVPDFGGTDKHAKWHSLDLPRAAQPAPSQPFVSLATGLYHSGKPCPSRDLNNRRRRRERRSERWR